MDIGRLAAILAVILSHAPNASITAHNGYISIKYNLLDERATLDLAEWEASILIDEHVGLYEGYTEIVL